MAPVADERIVRADHRGNYNSVVAAQDRTQFDCGVRLLNSYLQQRQGLGERLLIDALKRSREASRAVGSAAVIADAKDSKGVRFYERYGFKQLPEQDRHLFIAMKTIAML